MDLRIAGINPTGTLQLQKNNTVLATVIPPNTNDWQNWTTVSTKVSLDT